MKEIVLQEQMIRPFHMIGNEWMLITAGDSHAFNTMTASWGGIGVLWGKNVATVYIRPERFTKEFVDQNGLFTLSFFDETYRKALQFCGSNSGRDCDKTKETGLTPWFTDNTTAFQEAKLVLICRKLYSQKLTPECTIDPEIKKWYQKEGWHTMYVAEICKAYAK